MIDFINEEYLLLRQKLIIKKYLQALIHNCDH